MMDYRQSDFDGELISVDQNLLIGMWCYLYLGTKKKSVHQND
jgi:hypothetical protein